MTQFLFKYRITPQSTTGQSPSDLLFGRRLRSHLGLLHPDISAKVRAKQNLQKHTHDYHAQDRAFELDDLVFAKNYRQGTPWLPGVIVAKRSAISSSVNRGLCHQAPPRSVKAQVSRGIRSSFRQFK